MIIRQNSLSYPNGRFCIFLLAFAFSIVSSWPAAASQFDAYREDIAQKIESQKKKFLFPRVLVIDFVGPGTGIDAFGAYLADDLSNALENRLPPGRIVPRAKLQQYLISLGIPPQELRSISLAYWVAARLGANEILYGNMSISTAEIDLNLRLLRVSDINEAAKWNLKFGIDDDDTKSLLGKALRPGDAVPSVLAVHCIDENPEPNFKLFVEAGVTPPKMTYTPQPPYSDEARRNKISARRFYDVYLGTNGQPFLVVPHSPFRPEFDEIAITTIRRWKGNPSTKDGLPVQVCVPVEVTWKIY